MDALNRATTAIITEARGHIAAGHTPDQPALEARIRAAAERARADGAAPEEDVDRAERAALKQLERVLAVHRARSMVTREPAPRPTATAPRTPRALGRSRPTITGNMEVRRQPVDGKPTISWDGAPAIVGWEVRFSERPDPRADYVVRETLTLPPDVTTVALPLGEHPLRVHLLGRTRDGRLLRRALITALTRETWNERWQRRASAS